MNAVIVSGAVLAAIVTVAAAPPRSLQAQTTARPTLQSIMVDPYNVNGGNPIGFVIHFTGPVTNDSAIVVKLRSSDGSILLPSTVSLQPGKGSQVRVDARTSAVPKDVKATVTATADGVSRQADAMIRAPRRLASLTLSPDTVLRSSTTTATVTLDQAAWVDATVMLGNGGNVSTPSSVTIPSLQQSATFSVSPSGTGPRTITASLNGSSLTRTLTVLMDGVMSIDLSLPYTTATPGVTMNGTVTAKAASMPPEGVVMTLSASPSGILSLPASVSVLQPNTPVPFAITVGQVPSQTAVTITATLNALSKSASVTVNP
jgi:hypothetical protein